MTCQEVQRNLSLYLYGELDFAQEESLELHLADCSLCQRALAREKAWHTSLNAERLDVPLDLLSQCRRELRTAIASPEIRSKSKPSWWTWAGQLGISTTRWSMRVAVASFLVVLGFSAGRWIDRNGLPLGLQTGRTLNMGLFSSDTARIRDIQPGENNRVRIIIDQVHEQEVTGRADDEHVRRLLLAATKDPADPGIRVDSVEMLKGQDGSDVRDALLYSVRHDANAAVRLKAVEGLRHFTGDQATRDTLRYVLAHDDNPGVRSEAIDVLAPANTRVEFSPDLVDTLNQIIRTRHEDDYVRLRCLQILQQMNASQDVY